MYGLPRRRVAACRAGEPLELRTKRRTRNAGQQAVGMEISAALVKKLRDRTGAGMMECKAALHEANGDLEEATTILRKRGLAPGGQEDRPLDQRRPDRPLHPHGRQDRRARRAQLRVRLRGAHRRLPDAAEGDRACRSRPPARSTSGARTCRPTSSSASAGSTARRWRTRASRRRSSTRSSRASSAASTSRSCLVDQPSIRDPKTTVGQMIRRRSPSSARTSACARFVRFKVGEAA